jgi:hypothetical protein
VTVAEIAYGALVEDTITDELIFDQWNFFGVRGDVVIIQMVANDGLAPLLGLANEGGDVFARSDTQPDGTLLNAPINGVAELQVTLQRDGRYTIVATRVGNLEGTTTGSYQLSLSLGVIDPIKDLQDVTFRCGADEITTAMTMEFNTEGDDGDYYRVTVYGIDGFEPYIRFDLSFNPRMDNCTSDGEGVVGDEYTLPDTAPMTITQGSPYNAQHILTGMKDLGQINLIIGSRNGAPGRYLAVIEGLAINQPGDSDRVNLRLGPLATSTSMLVYMLRGPNSRLDPQVSLTTFTGNPVTPTERICDDAGRRACAEVTVATQYRVQMQDGTIVNGSRLDAGVKIATGNPDRVLVQFRSRTSSTQGAYTLLILGELPPRP